MKIIFILSFLFSVNLAQAVQHANCQARLEVVSPVASIDSVAPFLMAKDFKIGEALAGTPSLLITIHANTTGETLARTIIRIFSVEDATRVLVDEVTAYTRVREILATRAGVASKRKQKRAISASLRNALSLLSACEIN